MKRLIVIIALALILASPTWAGFGYQCIDRGAVPAAGGGSTLLVGDDTAYSFNTSVTLNPNYAVAGLFTATASGTAAKGYCHIRAVSGAGNAKMVIWNATGAVIAVSSSVAINSTGAVYEFTFSSGSISSGTEYGVGYVADCYTYAAEDGSSYAMYYNSNSYTTPTSLTGDTNAPGQPEAYVKS